MLTDNQESLWPRLQNFYQPEGEQRNTANDMRPKLLHTQKYALDFKVNIFRKGKYVTKGDHKDMEHA